MNGLEPKSMARSRFFGQPVQAEVNGNLCPVAIYYSSANLTSLLGAAEDSSRRFAPFHPRLRVTVPCATSTCYPRATQLPEFPPFSLFLLQLFLSLLPFGSEKQCYVEIVDSWKVVDVIYVYIYIYIGK